jgi:hypothetical protein
MKFRTAVLAFLFLVGFVGAGTSWADDNCDVELTLAGDRDDVARRPMRVELPVAAPDAPVSRDDAYVRPLRKKDDEGHADAVTANEAGEKTAGGD